MAFVLTLALAGVVAMALFVNWAVGAGRASEEDRRWEASRLLLGEGAHEFVAWDTRLMRPIGGSTAIESFIALARPKGFFWLEHLIVPWETQRPIGIRAILCEIEGMPAAYLHCYPRSPQVDAKLAVLSPSGEVLEEKYASEDACPPQDLVARLEALAKKTRAASLPKNEEKPVKESIS